MIFFSLLPPKQALADFIIWNDYEIVGPSVGQWNSLAINYQLVSDATGIVMLSEDYGVTWEEILQTPSYVRSVAISADGMYMTALKNEGNIRVSSNRGTNWSEIVNAQKWFCVAMSYEPCPNLGLPQNLWVKSASKDVILSEAKDLQHTDRLGDSSLRLRSGQG